jgi:GH15 family glucan-1,4-alpha-glucosidase
VRSCGAKQLDASLLLLPSVGFLPVSDPRIVLGLPRYAK